MPKINVYLPDDLAEAVRETGVPVSAICQRALDQAVRRVTAIRQTAFGDLDADALGERLPQFTARARTVLALAVRRAEDEDAASLDTAALLHALLAEGGNLAVWILRSMEIEPDRLAGQLATAVNGSEPAVADATDRRFSRPAANALELTVTEATALGHNCVGCEHLLLGLVAEQDGVAGRVLRAAGADPRLTRRAVAAALAGLVHLRARTPAPADAMVAVVAAVRQELQPVIHRIERLESRTAPDA